MDARRADETAHDGERARVLELLRRHGWNATSFQVLEPAFRYWFDEDACVAYADTGRAHVVAGAPIAAPGRLAEVTERFLEAARRRGRRVCFFGVEARFLEAVPIRATAIGEQAVWDPSAWGAALRTSKSLREQLRRARAKGAQVRLVSPAELADTGGPTRAAVERLVARWLGSRAMAPMGFLVAVEPFAFAAERRTWVAEVGGHVVGFLAAVPVYARGGWLLEDLLRDPEAPNGTAELLVDAAMRAFDDEGARYVTLGLAPLSGPLEGWLRTARDLTGALYDFRGLRAFKAKLRPARWEPIYLAHGDDVPGPRAIVDTLTAFAHGSLARFGLQTVLRGPAIVVQALAALLVPWTLALALALVGRHWFPSPWVQAGWVAFDAALAALLLALSVGWRPWLATSLAVAVTLDSALTLVEELVYNVPRARGPVDGLVLAIAWLAPTLAAVVLWAARAERARWLGRVGVERR